jgi:hypothetical protein
MVYCTGNAGAVALHVAGSLSLLREIGMRTLLLGGLIAALALNAVAVTSQTTAFAVPVTNEVVAIVSIYGELGQLAAGNGDVTYNSRGRIIAVGALPIKYDPRLRISKIGALDVAYDTKSRVSSIGALTFNYDPRSRIKTIGATAITYDPKSRVSAVTPGSHVSVIVQFNQ